MLRRASLLLLPLLLLPALLFALSGGEHRYHYPSPPRAVSRLVIASPQWEGIRYEIEEGFRRWLFEREGLGVEITWLEQGGGSKTLQWILQQFGEEDATRDSIGVDVLFGGGTDPYESLKARGLLERHDPDPALLDPARLPPHVGGFPLYDPEHFWFGTCLTGFGIFVNRLVFEALPARFGEVKIETWEDMADPRLAGWVGSADPRSSSSYHTYFEIVIQQSGGLAPGLRVLREIGGNVNGYTKYSAEIPKLCAVGQFAVAPTIDQYALAQIDKLSEVIGPERASVLTFVLPEGRTLVNADAAAILRGAPNRETARRFLDFLLSEEAAYLWMLKRGESVAGHRGPSRFGLNRATVLPGVFEVVEREGPERTLVRQNPFRMQFRFHYDYELARRRWTLVNDLLGALLIDTREELAGAIASWRGLEGDAKREAEAILFAVPFDDSELDAILRNDWKDPVKRERLKIEWTEFARARYLQVIDFGRRAAERAR